MLNNFNTFNNDEKLLYLCLKYNVYNNQSTI